MIGGKIKTGGTFHLKDLTRYFYQDFLKKLFSRTELVFTR